MEINYDLIPDGPMGNIDNTVLLSILIQFLVKQQREVIILEFIQGFSEKDIAKILGISRQAANKAINRALHNLRKYHLGDGGEAIGKKRA